MASEKMILKYIQRIMNENLLLLKDSLEPQRTKFINIQIQYEKKLYIDKLDDIVNELKRSLLM